MKIGMIFDLDGTLLDSLADLTDSTNYALGVCGFPPRTAMEVRSFVGNGARTLIRLALSEGTDPQWIDKVLEAYQPHYKAHCYDKTAPFPGILSALERLKGKYALAIVSNKPDAATKALAQQYFPGLYALGETPDCPRKPAPDMVHRAMAAMGVEKCIYVGDSEVDVLTARNAGVECLSVLWGFRNRDCLEQAGADHFCLDARELFDDLNRIAASM